MTETTPADDRAADLLVADARRAVHESLTFLAAPGADRVRALIADLETAVEGRTAIRFAAATVPASAPTDQAAKARSLLLHFAAEAHRRKWAYDRGLNDDGVPVKSEAFDALHQLGDEMRTALDKLRLADAASGPGRADGETQQDETQAAVIAELLPAWEAMYEPGNVSDYLIGYANDEAPAKAAAEAWLRSQAEVTGRLEWVHQTPLDGYDQEAELIERHDDGIDTGPGITVRRRVEPAAVPQPGKEANVCGPAPDQCDAETGEPCAKHEIERSHIEGDHSLCRSADCEVLRQS
jgi:hypothetical protein